METSENYYDNETVAYSDGSPMSRKEYKERLDIGLKQMEKGDCVSVEELK